MREDRGYSPPAPCGPDPGPELDARVRVRRARCCPREARWQPQPKAWSGLRPGGGGGRFHTKLNLFFVCLVTFTTIRPSPLNCRFKLHLTGSCAPPPPAGWGPHPGLWRGGAHGLSLPGAGVRGQEGEKRGSACHRSQPRVPATGPCHRVITSMASRAGPPWTAAGGLLAVHSVL